MSDLKVALTLTADGKQLIGTINNTDKVVSNLNTKLSHSQTASTKASIGLSSVERQSSKTAVSLKHMSHMAVGAFAGLSAINLGQQITQDLAAFQDIRTRLQSLSGSTAAYAANEQYLIGLTREHHKELIPLADNYASLLNLQDAGLLTQNQARALLEGMSNAQSALGASTEQLKQSLYGLSQGLASPIVRAEELNQIVEPMPGLLNKMDKAAKLPAGGFRKMVLDGKVTSEFLRNNLIKALQEYDGAAAATANNISAQTRDMKNAYQQLIVAFESPINDSLSPVLSSITQSLTWAVDNTDLLSTAFGVTMAAAMGRASVAIISNTQSTLAKVAADRASRLAAISAAEAELKLALAQRNSSISAGQATIAQQRLTAARKQHTAAMALGNRTSKAGAALLGAFGGPAGLAITAGAGILYFANSLIDMGGSADSASSKVNSLNKEMSDLEKLRHQKASSEKFNTLTTKTASLVLKLKQVNEQLAHMQTSAVTRDELSGLWALQISAKALKGELQAASQEQKKLFDAGLNSIKWNDSLDGDDNQAATAKIDKQQQQLLDNYRKQKVLLTDTSEAAKVRYEIEHGSLKQLDPVVNAQILQAAKALDATKANTTAAKLASDAADEQAQQLKALLTVLDPVSAAANEMAAKEQMLKQYFEQANVPLEKRQQLLAALSDEYAVPNESTEYIQLRGQLDPSFSENQQHDENMGVLNDELANTPESEAMKRNEINLLIEAEQQRHISVMNQINTEQMRRETNANIVRLNNASNLFGQMAQLTKAFGGEQSTAYKAMFAASKAFAIAESIIKIQQGIAAAASLPFPANIPAMATVVASTASIVSTISGTDLQGVAHDGIDNVPREGTWLLDRGERVVDSRTNADLKNALKNGSVGAGNGGMVIHQSNEIVVANQAEAETLEDVLPELVAMTKQAVVDDLNQRGDTYRAMES